MGTSDYDFSFPYPVCVYATTIYPTADNIGDVFDVCTAPDTVVGVIQDDISVGATGLEIGSVAPLAVGYYVNITDGVNTDSLGEIIDIDTNLNTIEFSTPTVNSFLAATPSYVRIGIPRLEGVLMVSTQPQVLGTTILDSATVPANTTIRIHYTNNGLTPTDLTFSVDMDY